MILLRVTFKIWWLSDTNIEFYICAAYGNICVLVSKELAIENCCFLIFKDWHC